MSATRNKNTKINYNQFIKEQDKYSQYDLYKHSSYGESYKVMQPGNGYNPGKFSRNALSTNSVDVESSLFGINSTNLVNPSKEVHPHLSSLKTNNIFEKDAVIMPSPLIVSNTQRPSMWN
tara:strand:+ start:518 stop:877 length:360 start_codon:yes stop_codon:yes gene_type:complete